MRSGGSCWGRHTRPFPPAEAAAAWAGEGGPVRHRLHRLPGLHEEVREGAGLVHAVPLGRGRGTWPQAQLGGMAGFLRTPAWAVAGFAVAQLGGKVGNGPRLPPLPMPFTYSERCKHARSMIHKKASSALRPSELLGLGSSSELDCCSCSSSFSWISMAPRAPPRGRLPRGVPRSGAALGRGPRCGLARGERRPGQARGIRLLKGMRWPRSPGPD